MPATVPLDPATLERLVVEPFFTELRDAVHAQLRGRLDVPPGNDYAAGRQETAEGLQLTVCSAVEGDDRYASTFQVCFREAPEGVELRLSGHLALYRHARRETEGCTAQAEESLELRWSGTFSVAAATDPRGGPALEVTRALRVEGTARDREENGCARALGGAPFPAPRLAALPELDLPLLAARGRTLVSLAAPAHPAGGA